jgi:hypothetical protein
MAFERLDQLAMDHLLGARGLSRARGWPVPLHAATGLRSFRPAPRTVPTPASCRL